MISIPRLLAACVFPLSSAFAFSLNAAQTVNYAAPVADTYVSNGGTDNSQAGTNYGLETTWRTRYPNHNSSNRKGYIRFNLNDQLTAPVESATLTVRYTSLTNANGTEATVQVYGLNHDYEPADGKLGLDWAETELTSDNAPWGAMGSNTVPAFVTNLGSFTISVSPTPSAGGEFSVSSPELTAFIETFRVNNENNITFIFRSTTSTFFSFAAKENEVYAAPSLSVTIGTSNIPEPSSFAVILGTAMLALVASRRIR